MKAAGDSNRGCDVHGCDECVGEGGIRGSVEAARERARDWSSGATRAGLGTTTAPWVILTLREYKFV